MQMAFKKPGYMQKPTGSAPAPASGKAFIAQKVAERQKKAAEVAKQSSAPEKKPGMRKEVPANSKKPVTQSSKEQQPPAKKEEAKAFLKEKTNKVVKKDTRQPETKKGAVAAKVVSSKTPVKEKKEAVLADARKKMGINEEKRAEFQRRSKESKMKRVEARQKTIEESKQSPAA